MLIEMASHYILLFRLHCSAFLVDKLVVRGEGKLNGEMFQHHSVERKPFFSCKLILKLEKYLSFLNVDN